MCEKIIKTITNTKPIRMWIDGKCFNLKQFKGQQKKCSKLPSISPQKGAPDESEDIEEELKVYNIDFDINDDGKLSTSFELPPLYYTKLKNDEFFDLNSLRNKTKTNIFIPNYGKNEKLVISGEDENGIREALNEIYSIIGHIRTRSMALQFIAIPLLSEEIRNNFTNFKNDILKDATDTRGLDESIFQSPLKLHLTIDIFVLLNEREKKEATQALEEFSDNILKPLIAKMGPLKIHVAGIECMNDDYEKVDVLYAKTKMIDETDEVNLQDIANRLSGHFYEKGLLKKHQENVKLHMTLMNTKYRKEPNSPRRRWTKRKNFDATKIMEKYKNYEFGQCSFNAIHIANISSIGKDGFYESLTSIKF